MAAPFLEQPQQAQAPAPAPQQPFATASQVVGDPQDEIRRRQALDPTGSEEVTDEEQDQYDDFVSRALSMIADNRKADDNSPSPSEAVLNLMNNGSFTVPEALAEGAASTVMLLHNAAKRANVAYPPDVIFHGADEIIAGLYLLGSAAGIFEGASDHSWAAGPGQPAAEQPIAPPDMAAMGPSAPAQPMEMPAMAPMEAPVDQLTTPPVAAAPAAAPAAAGLAEGELPSEGDFTEEEYMLLGEAKILATEKFGQKMVESGQLTEKEQGEAQAFWTSQIEKEVETGEVDDSVFDNVDVNSIRQTMVGK